MGRRRRSKRPPAECSVRIPTIRKKSEEAPSREESDLKSPKQAAIGAYHGCLVGLLHQGCGRGERCEVAEARSNWRLPMGAW